MSESLKPCPFCGSKDVAVYDNKDAAIGWWLSYGMLCLNCGARTELFDTTKAAVRAWNRRANDDI